jgi:hypothetical protein
MQSLRYVVCALALGLIAVWASESLFWIVPPAGLSPADWVLTWAAYALAAASVLSAVHLTRIGGLPAVFLGGALGGFLIEGVVVGEMYLAFPFQLVWTPLAWHALVSGVCVFALGRVAPHWRLSRHLAALAALAVFAAVWAQFWRQEHGGLDGEAAIFYLVLTGLGVPLGQIVLDRIGPVPRPPLWVALVVPVLAGLLWLAQTAADPVPQRLAWPVMVGATLWAMARLGRAGQGAPGFGPPAPVWRHLLFLLVPVVAAYGAVVLAEATGGAATNVLVAFVTVPLSLGWWLRCILRAARLSPSAPPVPRQDPSPRHKARAP